MMVQQSYTAVIISLVVILSVISTPPCHVQANTVFGITITTPPTIVGDKLAYDSLSSVIIPVPARRLLLQQSSDDVFSSSVVLQQDDADGVAVQSQSQNQIEGSQSVEVQTSSSEILDSSATNMLRITAFRQSRNAVVSTDGGMTENNSLVVILPDPVLSDPDVKLPPSSSEQQTATASTHSHTSTGAATATTTSAPTPTSSSTTTELDSSPSSSSPLQGSVLEKVLIPIGSIAIFFGLIACGFAVYGYLQRRQHEHHLKMMNQLPIGEQQDCENILVAPTMSIEEYLQSSADIPTLADIPIRQRAPSIAYASEGDGRTVSITEAVMIDNTEGRNVSSVLDVGVPV